MKKNVGDTDRLIRLVVGVVLLAVGYSYASILATIIGLVLLLTAVVGICPLYSLLGISTDKEDKGTQHLAG